MMPTTVKAAVMVAPGKLEVRNLPYPRLTDDSIIVKMEMSGICGTDKHTYRGEATHSLGGDEGYLTHYPILPGHENIGIVEELGKNAQKPTREHDGLGLKLGDRVFPACDVLCGECYECRYYYGYPMCRNWWGYGNTCYSEKDPRIFGDPPYLIGGWAEYMHIDPKVKIFKVPKSIPPNVGCLIEPMTDAYGAMSKATTPYPLAKEGFGPGDSVVVQGAGPIGACMITMARVFGAGSIIVVENGDPRVEYRLKLARELGANEQVSLKDSKSRVKAVQDLTGGRGADVVAECAGVPQAISEGLKMLRRGGTFLELGNYISMGGATIDPNIDILLKWARIIGINAWPQECSSRVIKIMERYAKEIPFDRIVTHVYKIDDVQKAMEKALSLECLKVAITP